MRKNLKNLFDNKNELNFAALRKCKWEELLQIVLKYDAEAMDYQANLDVHREKQKGWKCQMRKVSDELQLYKSNSDEVQAVATETARKLAEHKRKLQQISQENATLKSQTEILEEELKTALEEQGSVECKEYIDNYARELEFFRNDNEELKTENALLQEKAAGDSVKNQKLKGKLDPNRHFLLEKKVKDLKTENRELASDNTALLTKISNLEENLRRGLEQIQKVEYQLYNQQTAHTAKINEQHSEVSALKQELSRKTQEISLFNETLSHRVPECNEPYKSVSSEQLLEITQLKQIVHTLKTTNKDLHSSLERQFSRNFTENESLNTTKCEDEKPKFKELAQSPLENQALHALKAEADDIYRILLSVMTKATALRSKDSSILYQIPASEFSAFEKELHRLVMDIHDASDGSAHISAPSFMNTLTKIAKFRPSKLFSCMASRPNRSAHLETVPNTP